MFPLAEIVHYQKVWRQLVCSSIGCPNDTKRFNYCSCQWERKTGKPTQQETCQDVFRTVCLKNVGRNRNEYVTSSISPYLNGIPTVASVEQRDEKFHTFTMCGEKTQLSKQIKCGNVFLTANGLRRKRRINPNSQPLVNSMSDLISRMGIFYFNSQLLNTFARFGRGLCAVQTCVLADFIL